MSLIENNKLIQIMNQEKSFVEQSLEDDFEDTIYICEECGSKKIDLVQKQLRGAVSEAIVYIVFMKFLILFKFYTGRACDFVSHVSSVQLQVD